MLHSAAWILRLAMFTFTPAKIQACVTLLRDHKYISIVLIKRKHSYQFARGIKPSSPSARVFAANQVRIFIVIFCCGIDLWHDRLVCVRGE